MKKSYPYVQTHLILSLVVLITSCNVQNTSTPQHDNTSTPQIPPQKVDSILKFNDMIRVIFEDSKGVFWFGSHNDGLCRYDPSAPLQTGKKQFTYFTEKDGLANDQIRSIQEDNDGNLWLETGNGISKFDGQAFTTIQPEKENMVSSNTLKPSENKSDQDWEKELNCLWFGAGNKNGVYRYDGEKLAYLTLPVPEDYPEFDDNGYNPKHGYDRYAVYGIYKDKDKNLWLGTMGAGLYRYNGRALKCINEKDTIGVVRAIYQDKTGKIWFGNNAIGIYHYDGKTLVNFTKEKGQKKHGLNGALSIKEDKDGNLWFGTYDSGLWRYNPSASQTKPFPFNTDEKEFVHYTAKSGLNTNCISTIYKDKKDNLWFGTGRGEVFRFNGKTFDKSY